MDHIRVVFIAVFVACILHMFVNDVEGGQVERCPTTYEVTESRVKTQFVRCSRFRWCLKIRKEYYTVKQRCPSPNAIYQKWSLWGKCSAECGFGKQERTRTCHPKTSKCCSSCTGTSTQTKFCINKPCPIDGGWTDWDDAVWSNCSAKCDSGTTKRTLTRTCTNPRPAFGGKSCKGVATKEETKSCFLFECPETTCKKLKTGNTSHPDPQKCNMYLQCVNKAVHEMSCAPTTAWDKKSNRCDTKSAEKCLGTCSIGEFKAHPTDCSKYYHCASGTMLELDCPDGTNWNDKQKFCDHDYNVKCDTKDSEDDASDDEGIVCNEAGFSKHGTDCQKYYRCEGQTKHVKSCPPGLVFNIDKNTCDWARNVPGCSEK